MLVGDDAFPGAVQVLPEVLADDLELHRLDKLSLDRATIGLPSFSAVPQGPLDFVVVEARVFSGGELL